MRGELDNEEVLPCEREREDDDWPPPESVDDWDSGHWERLLGSHERPERQVHYEDELDGLNSLIEAEEDQQFKAQLAHQRDEHNRNILQKAKERRIKRGRASRFLGVLRRIFKR